MVCFPLVSHNRCRSNKALSLPYSIEREAARRSMEIDAASAVVAEINDRVQHYQKHTGQIAEGLIAHVNQAREIGLLLGELNDGQFTMDFYQSSGLRPNYKELKLFLSIANRFPKPVKTLAEVRSVIQLEFQAGGFLEIPDTAPAQAHEISYFSTLVNKLGAVKECISRLRDKYGEPEAWPEDLRSDVKGQFGWVADLIAAL